MSEIQDDYQEMCIALRQLIVTNNESMTKKHISEINTGLTKIPTVINATANQLKQVEATKRLEDLKKAFGTYSDVMNSMVGLYEKGQTDEIVDQLSKTSDLRNAERTMDTALDSLVYEVTSEASLINHDNTQTADTPFAITTAAVAAVLVLSSLIGFVIYKGISKPIKKLTVNLKQLAEGETDISSDKTAAKDELGQKESSFRQILMAIKTLEADTDMLIGAALEGALSVRADEQKHNGAYRKIVQGFNATLDAMMAPIDESTQVLYAFSQGSLNVAVEGEF